MLKNIFLEQKLINLKNCTLENCSCRVNSEKFGYGSGRVKKTFKIFGSGTGRVFGLFSTGRVNFGSGNYPQHP